MNQTVNFAGVTSADTALARAQAAIRADADLRAKVNPDKHATDALPLATASLKAEAGQGWWTVVTAAGDMPRAFADAKVDTPRRPHLMIDLETMGNGSAAVIASVGAVMFDPLDPAWTGARFYLRVDLDDSFKHARADGSTVGFWLRQADAPRLALLPPKGHKAPKLADVLNAFVAFYTHEAAESGHAAGALPVWSNGATFDIIILESAFAACGLEEPWKYSAVRDCRTLKDVAEAELPERTGTHHNALDDAIYQAGWVAEAFSGLRALPGVAAQAIALSEDTIKTFEGLQKKLTDSHDARVTELLAANNAEVDRRRQIDSDLAAARADYQTQVGNIRDAVERLIAAAERGCTPQGKNSRARRAWRDRVAELREELGPDRRPLDDDLPF